MNKFHVPPGNKAATLLIAQDKSEKTIYQVIQKPSKSCKNYETVLS